MRLLQLSGIAALFLLFTPIAFAGTYPSRPIRIVVPVPPGGANDLVARLVAEAITAQTGQTVVIDNRSGAGGNIGMSAVARAAPDGYTLLLGSSGQITTTRLLYKNPMLDPIADLEPIAPAADTQLVLAVNKDVPVKTLSELVALAQAQPGNLNYTSAGPGSGTHLAGDQLFRQTKASLTHVPYRGAAPALTDVVAGRVQAIVLGVNSLIPHIQSGSIKPLATASNKHFSYLSGVPSAAEAGVPDWNLSVWFGLFGPREMSQDIIDKLNGYVQKLADNPTVKAQMEKSYLDLMAMSSKQFSDFVRSEAEKWERIVQDSGIPPQ